MALDYKEIDVSSIAGKINSFWTSNLFQDKHITDQLWRGYLYVMENFYTQLYQLAKARNIQTFPADWFSHWERFEFNENTKVASWHPLYPYAYKLPKHVRSVYILRESPREITILPKGTVVDNSGEVILPSGTPRKPVDTIYNSGDYVGYSVTCPTCGGLGVYLGSPCPTCGGSGYVSGTYAQTGLAVDTVKYLKRADAIYDFDETTQPLGDFICGDGTLHGCEKNSNVEQYYIAFASEPYPVAYSQYVVRNTELIYELFGSLIGFYKKDSANYLRQVQALWYAFWNGSTFDNIKSGLSTLSELPVTATSGYVSDISEQLTVHKHVFQADAAFLSDYVYILPTEPTETSTPGVYTISVASSDLASYTFTQGVDYTVTIEYESSFTGGVPSIEEVVKVEFNPTAPVSSLIQLGTNLEINYEDGAGDYIVKISDVDYFINNTNTPNVYLNKYVEPYTPLTNDVGVYDYINFPNWWTSFLGGINIFDPNLGSKRLNFNSAYALDDPNQHLDNFATGASVKATLLPYHTFLVTLSDAAMPTTLEDLNMLKTFLNLIKPAYSHYIIVGEKAFEDKASARDAGFLGSEIQQVPFEHGDTFIRFDSWHYPKFDSGRKFDSSCRSERLLLTKIYPEYILHDDTYPAATFDDIVGRKWDSGNSLDRSIDRLDLTNQ